MFSRLLKQIRDIIVRNLLVVIFLYELLCVFGNKKNVFYAVYFFLFAVGC